MTDDFIKKTNEEYVAWCKSYYNPEALDERGMQSLHGLWAWQEQERRMGEISQQLADMTAERDEFMEYAKDGTVVAAQLQTQLAAFHSAVEHVTEDGCTRRSFVAMPEGWAMVHKDRLHALELAEEQLAATQEEYGRACHLVAQMHFAATGEVTGPKLGVVEDVAEVRRQLTDVRNQVLEECAAVAEDTAAGRDAEAIADAIRAMKRCISQ